MFHLRAVFSSFTIHHSSLALLYKTSHIFSLKCFPVQQIENNSTCKRTLCPLSHLYHNTIITPCFCSPSSPSLLFTVQAHRQAAEKQPWGLWFSTQYFLIRKKWQTDKNGIKAQRQTLSTRLVEGPKNILIYFHLKTSAYCLPIRYSSMQGCLYLPTTFLQNFYHRLQGCVIN